VLRLNRAQARLLNDVLASRAPELLWVITDEQLVELNAKERDDIRAAIAAELVSSGLAEDSEPTSHGRALDDLIGAMFDA